MHYDARHHMRIGFVLPTHLEGSHLGFQAYTSAVAAAWSTAGHDVHVLGPEPLRFPGVTWHTASPAAGADPTLRAGLKEFGDVYERAYAWADPVDEFARAVDVVECADSEAIGYFHLLRRLWRPRPGYAPLVLRWHTDTPGAWDADGLPRHGLFRYTRQYMEQAVLRMADAWLVPTDDVARHLRRGTRARTRTLVRTLPVAVRVPCDEPRRPELLWVGRLRRSAGVEVFGAAVERVLDRHADWSVRVLGDDWFDPLRGASMLRWLTARLARFGERVRFDRPTSAAETRAAVARAGVVVMPTCERSVSAGALDALAAGCLLVTTDLLPLDEGLRSTGAVVTCGANDAPGLCDALERAMGITPAERRTVGAAARAWLLAHASAEACVAALAPAYARIAAGPLRRALPSAAAPSPRDRAARRPGTCAVIVPCKNMGDTLGQTLESVFASTRMPDEVIVVDYGTTDPATLRVFDEWRARVQVIHTPCDSFGEARNAGAAASTSDVLAFLDADDLLDPRCFELGMEALSRAPHAGFVTTWVRTFGAGEKAWCPPAPHLPLELTRNVAVAFGMFRREAFRSSGGYKAAMRFGYEDWDVWIAMLAQGWSGLTIAEPLFLYRWRPGSSLRSMSSVTKASMQQQLLRLNPQAYAAHHQDVILMVTQQATEETDAMAERAERIAAEGIAEVAVYGAGHWGRVLCQELRRRGVRVTRMVDGNTALHGTVVDDVPVTGLDEALSDGAAAFAIGSIASVEPIRQRIRERAGALGRPGIVVP